MDDDQDCPHDWQLTGLSPDVQPGELVPRLSRVYECGICGAVSYETPVDDPNRPPLY